MQPQGSCWWNPKGFLEKIMFAIIIYIYISSVDSVDTMGIPFSSASWQHHRSCCTWNLSWPTLMVWQLWCIFPLARHLAARISYMDVAKSFIIMNFCHARACSFQLVHDLPSSRRLRTQIVRKGGCNHFPGLAVTNLWAARQQKRVYIFIYVWKAARAIPNQGKAAETEVVPIPYFFGSSERAYAMRVTIFSGVMRVLAHQIS